MYDQQLRKPESSSVNLEKGCGKRYHGCYILEVLPPVYKLVSYFVMHSDTFKSCNLLKSVYVLKFEPVNSQNLRQECSEQDVLPSSAGLACYNGHMYVGG